MTKLFPLLFLLLCSPFHSLKAQGDLQVFSSAQIRLINYGERLETGTAEPVKVILNLRDSVILVESTGNSDIAGFLRFNNRFEISRFIGKRRDILVYTTAQEYIFSFNLPARTILIGKEREDIRMHSLLLDLVNQE